MVRFARAQGSKGSNKRVFEEATPWSQMANQMKKVKTENLETKGNDGKQTQTVEHEGIISLTLKIKEERGKVGKKIKNKSRDKKKRKKEGANVGEETEMKKVDEGEIGKEKIMTQITKSKKNKKLKDNDVKCNKYTDLIKENVTNIGNDKTESKVKTIKKEKASTEKAGDGSVSKKIKKLSSVKLKSKREKSATLEPEKENISVMKAETMKKQNRGIPWVDIAYEENDIMTRYEDVWVKREAVAKLEEMKRTLEAAGNREEALRKIKKAKKREHKALSRQLLNEKRKELSPNVTQENSEEHIVNTTKDGDVELAWFNNFMVTKDGAKRLKKLQADLTKKRVPKERLREVMKRERRKEEKLLRREKKQLCLRCRQRGHLLSECPNLDVGFGEDQKVCYSCGSAEHISSKCPLGKGNDSFPHAKCFVCNKIGHISRQCPDNPRGLYPNGGSCRGCGSVEHLAANCSKLQAEKESETIKLGRIDGGALESMEFEEATSSKNKKLKLGVPKEVKIVIF